MEGVTEGLMKRFRDLEASQAKLREQVGMVAEEGVRNIESEEDEDDDEEEEECRNCNGRQRGREFDVTIMPGYFAHSPFRSVLYHIGHAVSVCRPDTGAIVFWNRSAENLYGWKEFEVLGQNVASLIINEGSARLFEEIMEMSKSGKTWSGLFPAKKRSKEMFMAMVTQSPLYESGVLIGAITVSSDSATLNDVNNKSKLKEKEEYEKPRESKINFKRVSMPRQQQIVSTVSNLASKIFLRNHAISNHGVVISQDWCGCMLEEENILSENASISASKFIFKLHARLRAIEEMTNTYEEIISNYNQHSRIAAKVMSKFNIRGSTSHFQELDQDGQSTPVNNMANGDVEKHQFPGVEQCEKEIGGKSTKSLLRKKHTVTKLEDCVLTSVVSLEANSSSLVKRKLVMNCDIHWEDLLLGEQIGQGSCAVVYRGAWNGSDVAIKVYVGNDYHEELLTDYQKEISIMKRLRHPNVLLFMGAVYSPERLAIVTEYLPRGSLFRALHRSSHKLDIKRRLSMALDVAKGMNYLHRRSPPIIHRDLKSSNLLVDRNWTVKLGDFGLSCLKTSTFLTATSGKGTPQWMAPEVLRGECSNEKSDVFSFGVILWELMTEAIPWSQLNPIQVIGVVGFQDRRLDIPEGMDPSVSSIIRDCWQSEPERRPTSEELVRTTAELMAALANRRRSRSGAREMPRRSAVLTEKTNEMYF